jgi:DNA gyrase subunit B
MNKGLQMADKGYKASDIKVLSDREHVRLRTAIYLGSTEDASYEVPIFEKNDIKIKHKTFIPAIFKAFNEISDNAIDELTQLKKKDKKITFAHDTILNRFKVCDNGRGVPIDMHPQTNRYTPETVFTELRSGRNFDDGAKDSGVIGTNGVGSSCVAMLSEEFHVSIKRDGKFYEQMYRDGTAQVEDPFINNYKGKDTGTCIDFKIDTTLSQFVSTKIDPELIQNRVIEIALNNPHLDLSYSRKQLDDIGEEEQLQETYSFKGGMAEYIKHVSDRFFEFKYDHDDFTARYYVILDKYQGIDEKVFVYVNSSLLFEGGTAAHMFFNTFFNGVNEGLKREVKKRKIDLNKNDVKQNLLVVADVKMKNPRYDNQSKTRLISQEIKKHIDKMVNDQMSKFLSSNKDWIEEILDRAEFRQRIADMAEVKKTQKKKKGKLAKLIDCYTKERGQASISFSEGDCVDSTEMVLTQQGMITISELKPDDMVVTHTGALKKVVVNNSVEKEAWTVETSIGSINFSEDHKHPVYNKETKSVDIVTTKDINPQIHQLLKKKELI